MSVEKLKLSISSVDWTKNAADFLGETDVVSSINAATIKLATWAKQLEGADRDNPALAFVRDMQISAHQAIAGIALGLYRSAAALMRGMLESCLYYSYFRTHFAELATLVRDDTYYISIKEILEYHKKHSAQFNAVQHKIGIVSGVNAWYSVVSSIAHSQIPGSWTEYRSLSKVGFHKITAIEAAKRYVDGVNIVSLFLCATVGTDLWDQFTTTSKIAILKGLSGEVKAALALDFG